MGVVVGLFACLTITHQIWHEWSIPGPSSVSLTFVGGFFLIYGFWFLYGLRFSRMGIWLPNSIAICLQLLFAGLVIAKGS